MGSQTRRLARQQGPSPEPAKPKSSSGVWLFLDRLTDRFGPAAVVLVFIFGCIKVFATKETQDRVMRELFFRSETNTPYVQIFIGFLLLLVALDVRLIWRYLSGERGELKRVTEEKTRLQEELLGKPVSHSRTPE